MARFDLKSLPPIDPRSRWRCPCGFEDTYYAVRGHRYHLKGHPQCKGKMVKIWDPAQDTQVTQATETTEVIQDTQVTPIVPAAPEATATELPPQAIAKVPVYEYLGADEELPEQISDDPEVIARRYLEQLNKEAPTGVGGDGHGELEGDFIVEQTAGPVSLQKVRQTVELPPVVLVWYDYYKNQGWMQGDGSISSFVIDFLLDHIRNCLGMRVIIVSETEVEIVEQSRS